MNTLKTIYDKLGDKTELAKHEVNLALIDNIKKSIKDLEVLFTDASKTENELDKTIKVLYPLLNKADALAIKIKQTQDTAINFQKQYVSALIELGIKPSESKENMALFNVLDSIETRRERIVSMLANFN
jgi:hypothetical protein